MQVFWQKLKHVLLRKLKLLDDPNFLVVSQALLGDIANQLSESLENKLVIEHNDGVLILRLETEGEYVLSRRTPEQQIHFESPLSGAMKFSFDPVMSKWLSLGQEKVVLKELLAKELRQITGTHFLF